MINSYKKTAAAIIILTLLISTILITVAYRSESTVPSTYILKEYNGAVALYKDNTIVTVFDGVVLSSLPYADREQLGKGITVKSPEEAQTIIEDYDG